MRPHQIIGAMSIEDFQKIMDAIEAESPEAAQSTTVAAAQVLKFRPKFLLKQAPAKRLHSVKGALSRVTASAKAPAVDAALAAGPKAKDTPRRDAQRQAEASATAERVVETGSDPFYMAAPTPRVLTRKPELDLVALIAQGAAALSGPVPLDARIPEHPETQLAVDSAGTVHLLKKGSGVVSEDVMSLIEAGRWVHEHLELIALTQRDHDFVDTEPVLHLLTDRADSATKLVSKLAGQIKLHLLQEVKLGRESGWFCTPLG